MLPDSGTSPNTTACAQVRTDLVDCGIYICEPDVLALFSDNWDYQARAPLHVCAVHALPASCRVLCVGLARLPHAHRVPRRVRSGALRCEPGRCRT